LPGTAFFDALVMRHDGVEIFAGVGGRLHPTAARRRLQADETRQSLDGIGLIVK